MKYLHFADNNTLITDHSDPNYDWLGKVQPIIDTNQGACKANYNPHCFQSIDEAMVAFKGRCSVKQYMPQKPTKRGFKVWVRADSTNGYVSQFECYTGKKGSTTEHGLGGSVVTRLTRDLVGKYFHVFMDNFFSSVTLFQQLLAENIYATGTLRSNRKQFPSELLPIVKKGLPSCGDYSFRQDSNLAVIVWQDTKAVVIMSIAHNPSEATTVKRKKGDGSTLELTCPQAIVDCNQHMGGVDRGDQYRKYYQVRMKSRKSYRYIFWFLFEISVLNSFVLHHYSPCTSKILNYLDFCVQLAKELIGNYCNRKTVGRLLSTGVAAPKRITTLHFPSKTKRGRCQYCKKWFTVWFCSDCDRHLCHTGERDTDCYLAFHAQRGLM